MLSLIHILGLSMRGTEQNVRAAQLVGVNVRNVITFTFALSGISAALAAFLVAGYYNTVYPTMGVQIALKAFAAAVLGGIGVLHGLSLIHILLKETGVGVVCIGHSERRHVFGEDDEAENRKVLAALRHHITPLLCVGETDGQKGLGIQDEILRNQLKAGLRDTTPEQAQMCIRDSLSAASFQETTKVLTEAAINGKIDHLIGLKDVYKRQRKRLR